MFETLSIGFGFEELSWIRFT